MSSMSSRRPTDVNHGVRWVIGLGLFVNLFGYAVYKNVGEIDRWAPAFSRGTSHTAPDVSPSSAMAEARRRRTTGLKALEDGHYAMAIQSFQEALRASDALPDVPDLLRIAKELHQKSTFPVVETNAPQGPVRRASMRRAP